MAIQCDVASHDNVKALFEMAINAFGMVDVVIHAAGVLGPVSNIGDAPVEEWWSAFVSCESVCTSTAITRKVNGNVRSCRR